MLGGCERAVMHGGAIAGMIKVRGGFPRPGPQAERSRFTSDGKARRLPPRQACFPCFPVWLGGALPPAHRQARPFSIASRGHQEAAGREPLASPLPRSGTRSGRRKVCSGRMAAAKLRAISDGAPSVPLDARKPARSCR